MLAATEGTCTDGTASAVHPAGADLSSLTNTDLLAAPAVRAVLATDLLGGHAPAASVLVVHSREDDLVPFSQGADPDRDLDRRGCAPRHGRPPERDSRGAYLVVVAAATDWLKARFAGTTAPDSC